MPDVCVDLALHIFELIEFFHGLAMVFHDDTSYLVKCFRIEEAEFSSAIAQDEAVGVVRQAPALPFVLNAAHLAQGGAIVDKGDLCLPCELDQGAAPVCEAFGKVLARNIDELQNAT